MNCRSRIVAAPDGPTSGVARRYSPVDFQRRFCGGDPGGRDELGALPRSATCRCRLAENEHHLLGGFCQVHLLGTSRGCILGQVRQRIQRRWPARARDWATLIFFHEYAGAPEVAGGDDDVKDPLSPPIHGPDDGQKRPFLRRPGWDLSRLLPRWVVEHKTSGDRRCRDETAFVPAKQAIPVARDPVIGPVADTPRQQQEYSRPGPAG